MKAKELVDQVIAFYKTPGNLPGIDNHGYCVYYSSSNKKCAVGVVVSDAELLTSFVDKHYSAILGTGIEDVYNYVLEEAEYSEEAATIKRMIEEILPEDLPYHSDRILFLKELQKTHDCYANGDALTFADVFERQAYQHLRGLGLLREIK